MRAMPTHLARVTRFSRDSHPKRGLVDADCSGKEWLVRELVVMVVSYSILKSASWLNSARSAGERRA
jgi:hypothetical protein